MFNFTHTVQNADIPVIYTGVSVYIHVKGVIRYSGIRVVLQDIDACIVASDLMPVKCVERHSMTRAIL
jgi:acetaldehyde dehydrogenase (acetylating)